MEFHTPDFVRVTIDGSDRTDYVIAYQRQSSICSFSDTFGLELNFDIPVDPQPYDEIVIRELYDGDNEKVLSGYIIDVTQTGNKGSFIINGQDKTLLLDDYFIPTQVTANGESATYWISWYASQVDLDVQFDANYVSVFIVEPETPMGMMTCSQGLGMLERLAAVYIKYDADIDKLRVFRINTSEPVINITNDATTRYQRELGTEKTRNKVNVYGGYQFNIFTGQATQVLATATTVLDELIVDKTVVMANPLIRRQTIANLVATRILHLVDDIDDVVNLEVAGFYPEVDVGDFASIDVGRGDFTYAADREITSIQTSVDPNGAITVFTVGEKCPRVSIMPPLSVVYATAINGGVLVSWDGGESFGPFNRGLPGAVGEVASGLNGYSIAANKYGQLMSIVGSGLYKRTGKYGSWTEVSLPDPSNDEAEHYFGVTELGLQKVEKESGYFGRFHVLTNATASGGVIPSGQERWWNYWTQSYGTAWDSMQLYVPGSGVASGVGASGLPIELYNGAGITHDQLLEYTTISGVLAWNVTARDIEGAVSGNVTILVQGSPEAYIPEDTVAAETFYTSSVAYAGGNWLWRGSTWWMDGSAPFQGNDRSNWIIGETIISDGGAQITNLGIRTGNVACFSIPNNREMCYAIAERGPAAGLSVARTTGYRPDYGWQDVPTWEWVQSAGFDVTPVVDFFRLQSYSVLLDYSSLKPGSDLVKFCVIGAALDSNSGGGDNYPSNTNLAINCYFFEDDITASGTISCSVTNDNRLVGIEEYSGSPLSYTGEGTYGWEAQGQGTASPVPRGFTSQQPMGQGAQPCCVTTNLTGGNYGYWAVIVRDIGHWHGDARDAGWPTPSHPRDWEEFGTLGVYVVKIDFDAKAIASISLWQGFGPDFHDPPADTEQPQRDIDIFDYWGTGSIFCMMVQPNLAFFVEPWNDTIGHYLTYPGLGEGQHDDWDYFVDNPDAQRSIPINMWAGVRKTPFFSGTPVGYAAIGRVDGGTEYTGTSDSRMLYRNYTEDAVTPIPTMPSGMLQLYRGHPDFGYVAMERRAVASDVPGQDPMLDDHLFLWKSQRATPTYFEVQGNSSRYTDPYAQISYGVDYSVHWDFRTASGTIMHSGGGDYTNWNWLNG